MAVVKARVGSSWVPLVGGNVWDTSWGIVAVGDTTNNIVATAGITPVPVTTRSLQGAAGSALRHQVPDSCGRGVRNGVTTTSPGSSYRHFDLYSMGPTSRLGDS